MYHENRLSEIVLIRQVPALVPAGPRI